MNFTKKEKDNIIYKKKYDIFNYIFKRTLIYNIEHYLALIEYIDYIYFFKNTVLLDSIKYKELFEDCLGTFVFIEESLVKNPKLTNNMEIEESIIIALIDIGYATKVYCNKNKVDIKINNGNIQHIDDTLKELDSYIELEKNNFIYDIKLFTNMNSNLFLCSKLIYKNNRGSNV